MDKTREFVIQKSSEEAFDLECGPCKSDNNISQASRFCSDCSEYLCEDCYRTHCRPLPCRHHVLLDSNAMPKDKTTTRARDVSSVRCQHHAGQLVDYYCPKHKFLGCSICITLQHRVCEGVMYIPDETDGYFESEEYQNLTKNLQKCLKQTEDNTKCLDTTKNETQRLHDSRKDKLKQFRDEINACVDKLEKNIEKESKIFYHQNMVVVEEVEKENKVLGDRIKYFLGDLNKNETMQKGIDSYIAIKKYTQAVKLFEDESKDVRNKTKIKRYYFECDIKLFQEEFCKLSLGKDAPTDGLALARAMYVGARVQPGKDWKGNIWKNHYGTVTCAHRDLYVNVKWDSGGFGEYNVGNNNIYELMFVPGTY